MTNINRADVERLLEITNTILREADECDYHPLESALDAIVEDYSLLKTLAEYYLATQPEGGV